MKEQDVAWGRDKLEKIDSWIQSLKEEIHGRHLGGVSSPRLQKELAGYHRYKEEIAQSIGLGSLGPNNEIKKEHLRQTVSSLLEKSIDTVEDKLVNPEFQRTVENVRGLLSDEERQQLSDSLQKISQATKQIRERNESFYKTPQQLDSKIQERAYEYSQGRLSETEKGDNLKNYYDALGDIRDEAVAVGAVYGAIAAKVVFLPVINEQEKSDFSESLSARIKEYGSALAIRHEREWLVRRGIFAKEEIKAILRSGLVRGADIEPEFYKEGFKDNAEWDKAVWETAAGILEADLKETFLTKINALEVFTSDLEKDIYEEALRIYKIRLGENPPKRKRKTVDAKPKKKEKNVEESVEKKDEEGGIKNCPIVPDGPLVPDGPIVIDCGPQDNPASNNPVNNGSVINEPVVIVNSTADVKPVPERKRNLLRSIDSFGSKAISSASAPVFQPDMPQSQVSTDDNDLVRSVGDYIGDYLSGVRQRWEESEEKERQEKQNRALNNTLRGRERFNFLKKAFKLSWPDMVTKRRILYFGLGGMALYSVFFSPGNEGMLDNFRWLGISSPNHLTARITPVIEEEEIVKYPLFADKEIFSQPNEYFGSLFEGGENLASLRGLMQSYLAKYDYKIVDFDPSNPVKLEEFTTRFNNDPLAEERIKMGTAWFKKINPQAEDAFTVQLEGSNGEIDPDLFWTRDINGELIEFNTNNPEEWEKIFAFKNKEGDLP